jgi:hypothetical protein
VLTENENIPADDMTMPPYRHLAAAVIHAALVDFGVVKPTKRSRSGLPSALTPNYQDKISAKLSRLRRQIRAGEFLVERNDLITLLWFRVSNLNIENLRAKKTHWPWRLKAMREREAVLIREFGKRQRKQMAKAREARHGDGESDQGVGRHVEQRGPVQRPDVQREDRVGAGLLLWPEDVLQRPGRPAADVNGHADRPVDRGDGRDDGSLGDLPRQPEVQGARLTC